MSPEDSKPEPPAANPLSRMRVLFRNPISLAGVALALVSIANIVFLFLIDVTAEKPTPYIGILAYLTLWLTTIAGLCISGGLFPKWGAVLMPVHQLADLALSLALLHAALLLGDRYAGFTPESLIVPFRSTYEPFWSGLGILALYLGAIVFWSVDIRPKIGYARWRALHYLAFVVYVLALAHGLFAGTDREAAPMRLMYIVTGGAVMGLSLLRTVALARATPKPATSHGAVVTGKKPVAS